MNRSRKQLLGAIGLGITGWPFLLVAVSVKAWFNYGTVPFHINAGLFEICEADDCFSNDPGVGTYLGRVFGFITFTSIFASVLLIVYHVKYAKKHLYNILLPGLAIAINIVVGFLTIVIFCTLGKREVEVNIRKHSGYRVEMGVSLCMGLMLIGMFFVVMSMVATILHLRSRICTKPVAVVATPFNVEVTVEETDKT